MSYEIPEHIKNANPLSVVDRHQFFLGRLKHVPFTVQEVTLPSLTGNPVAQNTPFSDLYYPGSGLEWGPLQVIILVDEYLLNYKELYRWMVGIYSPTNFLEGTAYGEQERAKRGMLATADIETSDAMLTILDNNRQPTIRFQFHSVFPTELGAITFTTTDTGANFAKVSVSFRYTSFEIVDMMTPPSGA